jgi:hypothetical protein
MQWKQRNFSLLNYVVEMKKCGIIGGVGTVLLANIHSSDIFKTAVLAGVGAIVSTLVTLLIKRWMTK